MKFVKKIKLEKKKQERNEKVMKTLYCVMKLVSQSTPPLSNYKRKTILKDISQLIGDCLGPIARLMLGTCSSHSKATACPCSPIIRCPHCT